MVRTGTLVNDPSLWKCCGDVLSDHRLKRGFARNGKRLSRGCQLFGESQEKRGGSAALDVVGGKPGETRTPCTGDRVPSGQDCAHVAEGHWMNDVDPGPLWAGRANAFEIFN